MQNAQDTQHGPNRNVPNIVESLDGWYPRWWLLAAISYGIILVTLMVLWTPVICPTQQRQALPFVCSIVTNTWYIWKVILFWLVFFAFHRIFIIYLLPLVEIPQQNQNPLLSFTGNFIRSMSQFSALHYMLLLQGLIAFILLHVMWWSDRSPPAAFATLSIVVFLAHCSFFYHTRPANHRSYTIGYGLITLINLFIQMFFRRNFFNHWPPNDEWPLLVVEFVVIVIGIAALFYRGRRAPYATAQAARNATIDESMQPQNVFRNMWPFSRLWPQHPPQIQNDDDDTLPGNPDPGIP